MTHGVRIVQNPVEPLWICLANTTLSVCAERELPENLLIEHVISRYSPPRTPFRSISFLHLCPGYTGCGIETAVRRIHPGSWWPFQDSIGANAPVASSLLDVIRQCQ